MSLTLNRGLYSVALGDTQLANMAVLPVQMFTNSVVYLRVWFSDGVGSFQALTPDQRVTSAGYAMIAATVSDQAITEAKLAPGALNATNLVGTLAPERLPTNVVYVDSGYMLVSHLAQDASLLAKGLVQFMTVPAPAWVNGATDNAPSARYGHTAIWTGQEMMIWGGAISTELYWVNTGGRFQPEADAWTTLSTLDCPTPRWRHTAVWSGQEMIVWGGSGAQGYFNTGGRYQPANLNWHPVTTTGAPTERSGHIAVWTGSRMLIWGGQNNAGLVNDGALYDPVANEWTALNLPSPPGARVNATAVWTGDRLLVWGGEGGTGLMNSGAQLLFTDSQTPAAWLATALATAPSPRSGHSMVWTGQKMIVWGGSDGTALNDGAAFDPARNSWEPLPTDNAPGARFNHAAVWTGQEMLLMGGSNGLSELASGAAYDPGKQSWRALSSAGSPLARTDAVAVWSGAELLVFGGRANSQPLGVLQRLNPQPNLYFYRKP